MITLTDTTKFVRDPFSKGIVSVDRNGLNSYRNQRQNSQELITLKADINKMKEEFEDLRRMLTSSLEHNTP